MPVSILEAWQVGVPVVAAEWWCARGLISHGETGLICTPDAASIGEHVASLLVDPERARAMGEAGRSRVMERYAPSVVAARHEAAYRAAVG